MTGELIAAAAQAVVGAPFRLHGRDPATGLDCVGVLAVALKAAGREVALPQTYALRKSKLENLDKIAALAGMIQVVGTCRPGDVLLVKTAPCQFHFLIAARDGGFIHADASRKRVVHTPGSPIWPVIAHYGRQHAIEVKQWLLWYSVPSAR